jgi:hypothetical protein
MMNYPIDFSPVDEPQIQLKEWFSSTTDPTDVHARQIPNTWILSRSVLSKPIRPKSVFEWGGLHRNEVIRVQIAIDQSKALGKGRPGAMPATAFAFTFWVDESGLIERTPVCDRSIIFNTRVTSLRSNSERCIRQPVKPLASESIPNSDLNQGDPYSHADFILDRLTFFERLHSPVEGEQAFRLTSSPFLWDPYSATPIPSRTQVFV